MTKHALAPIATVADLLHMISEDPRVKAYPRLVDLLREVAESGRSYSNRAEQLLRDLGEL